MNRLTILTDPVETPASFPIPTTPIGVTIKILQNWHPLIDGKEMGMPHTSSIQQAPQLPSTPWVQPQSPVPTYETSPQESQKHLHIGNDYLYQQIIQEIDRRKQFQISNLFQRTAGQMPTPPFNGFDWNWTTNQNSVAPLYSQPPMPLPIPQFQSSPHRGLYQRVQVPAVKVSIATLSTASPKAEATEQSKKRNHSPEEMLNLLKAIMRRYANLESPEAGDFTKICIEECESIRQSKLSASTQRRYKEYKDALEMKIDGKSDEEVIAHFKKKGFTTKVYQKLSVFLETEGLSKKMRAQSVKKTESVAANILSEMAAATKKDRKRKSTNS